MPEENSFRHIPWIPGAQVFMPSMKNDLEVINAYGGIKIPSIRKEILANFIEDICFKTDKKIQEILERSKPCA